MLKKLIIGALILVSTSAALLFIYRFHIMQYSAEQMVRRLLPDYIRIDKMHFNFEKMAVEFEGFKILNPPEFSEPYLMETRSITAGYSMKGKNIFDGIVIGEPVFTKPVLYVERSSTGALNVTNMQKVINSTPKAPAPDTKTKESRGDLTASVAGLKFSDMVRLPQKAFLKDGKVVFMDKFDLESPRLLTFENVDAEIDFELNADYTSMLRLGFKGTGLMGGRRDEVVSWVIAWNPVAPRLTMSNRFEVSNVAITPFEPYYDKYSPLVFKKGRFSGTLIFDFDDGRIGSTNEVHLSDFLFYVKPGYENAPFWETTVPDLVKYFSAPSGDIVFDFKIKGDLQEPRFYLGPISKQAIASMAIDKVSAALQQISQAQGGAAQGAPKNDIEKVQEYVDLFREMMKKK